MVLRPIRRSVASYALAGDQTADRAGNCRAGVLSGVIAVKPERGTDESAVPLLRPCLGSSLSASGRSKTALMLSPDLHGRLALLVRTQAARCCATADRAPAALAPPPGCG